MDRTSKYSRILICGGRDFNDEAFLRSYLDYKRMWFADNCEIIHGDARGADKLAGKWAESRGYTVRPFPAEWDNLDHPEAIIKTRANGKKYNVNAGFIRNKQMLIEGNPDLVIAFPGGNGTDNMIEQADKANVEIIKVKYR